MPPELSPLAEVFAALEALFRRLGLPWYLFGAQAALLHGAARLTADVDVTLDARDVRVADLVHDLGEAGFATRLANASEFAERTRVLPITHAATGIPVDIVLAGPGLEPLFFSRAEVRDVDGVRVHVARAEDIVAMKILAGRPKDLDDASAILTAAGDRLDEEMIRETLTMLEEALSQSDLLPRLQEALSRSRRS